ncbi:MAG: DUF420 domain-containing protein [Bacteroidales bacterium]
MTLAATLPHVTAALNAAALAFMVGGFALVRRGHRHLHRRFMLAAVAASALFLAAYVTHHAVNPIFSYPGGGSWRTTYYALLVSHVVLAALVAPLVAVTLWRALAGHVERHRGLARWTLPLWLYVSVTGIAVYALLYHLPRPT